MLCTSRINLLISILITLFTSSLYAETIKIGGIYALSGDIAEYGIWSKRGAELAKEKFEREQNKHKIKFYIEDSLGDPKTAISAYRKISSINEAKFYNSSQSSIALALSPLVNKDKNILIDFSATTPKYSSPNDYTFRTSVVATEFAKVIAETIFNKFKIETLACLYIENSYGNDMYNELIKNYKGKIVIKETFNEKQTDYRSLLLRIKKSNVNNVWLASHFKNSGLIYRQAKELGLNFKFFADVYSIEGKDFLVATETINVNDVFYLSPIFDENVNETATQFSKDYKNKYNEEANYFAAQSFDAVLAIGLSSLKCKNPNPKCIRDELYKISFHGASGKIKFDEFGDVSKKLILKQVKNSKFVDL